MSPRVTTIIPAYNAAPRIARAIAGALAQDIEQEILVIDDGSSDDTRVIARRFGAPIEVIAKPNGGVSSARNVGLDRARGEFIAFLDADDIWLPGKLKAQLTALESFPQAGTVITDEEQIGEFGQVLQPSFFATLPFHAEFPQKTTIAAKPLTWLVQACYLPTSAVVTRAAVARSAGRFDESISIVEDRDYWFRLLLNGQLVIIPQIWLRYLVRDTGLRVAGTRKRLANVERVLERYRRELEERLPLEGTEPSELLGRVYLDIARQYWHSGSTRESGRMFGRASGLEGADLLRWIACRTGTARTAQRLRKALFGGTRPS